MTINNQPLITVITIAYNAFSTIEQTILSVINQTYPHIEYIIIDGGSNDGTVNIIEKYSNKLSYWISEPDKGIYDAMNKGIHLAKGRWVNFMNSGDTFYDNMTIEKVINKANWDSDIIYGNTNLIYSFGRYIQKGEVVTKDNYMPFCHQSSFSNCDLMKKYGFNIEYKICADKNFFYTAKHNNAKFEYVDVIISNYDAEQGVSANNMIRTKYEKGIIEKRYKNLTWKINYIVYYVTCNIKNNIKKIIPHSIFLFIKKQKIRNKFIQN